MTAQPGTGRYRASTAVREPTPVPPQPVTPDTPEPDQPPPLPDYQDEPPVKPIARQRAAARVIAVVDDSWRAASFD